MVSSTFLFVLLSASIIHAALPSKAKSTCSQFKSTLANITILPNDPTYQALATENWSATAWAKPTCIVQPGNVAQAQQIVAALTKNGVPFAMRSGGHMPSPLGANINDGVLIDLVSLNRIDYDATKNVVTIGAGLRWGQVYSELEKYKVTVVGGRVLDVGVSGLTLGNLYGLACDNVVNFEVVLAGGKAVNANARENQDLFWALKGGLNNFGLVTSFTLKTYPIYQVWGGVKFYNFTDLRKLLQAANKYQSTPTKDPYANFMMQAFPTNQSIGVVLNMVYLKPEASPPAFAPFYEIPTIADTTKIQTLREMMSGQGVPDIPRWDWRTTSFTPSEDLYKKIGSLVTTSPEVKTIGSLNAGSLALGLQPISTSLVDAGIARGGNALGLDRTNQTWWVLDTGHWLAKDDSVAHEATKSLMAKIDKAIDQEDSNIDYRFMSDASWDQDVLASYGADNVAKLKKVRAKYDPGLIFTYLVPGGFKLR